MIFSDFAWRNIAEVTDNRLAVVNLMAFSMNSKILGR